MSATEFDTSDLAWMAYEVLYDLNCIPDKNEKRPFIKKQIKGTDIKFSGETDFNFGKGYCHSVFLKYKKLLKEIESNPNGDVPAKEKYCEMYEKHLDLCTKLYKTVVNISLMPQTGNLQATKKGLGNDRIDVFIWALDRYFDKNQINLLTNNSTYDNLDGLNVYLESFDSVYDYCEKIYHINASLVDELIESGKKAIDCPERAIEYMNLALRFWNQKVQYFNSVSSGNLNLELKENLKLAQTYLNSFFE